MKRYALFGGLDYYPGGGWEDFIGTFDTIEEATRAVSGSGGVPYESKPRDPDWWHIVDLTTGERVL